jgi:hypothetical protein
MKELSSWLIATVYFAMVAISSVLIDLFHIGFFRTIDKHTGAVSFIHVFHHGISLEMILSFHGKIHNDKKINVYGKDIITYSLAMNYSNICNMLALLRKV